MRATVTIGDDLFAVADKMASRLGVSRSRLYQKAIESYVNRLKEEALTQEMTATVERLGQPADEALRRYVARVWKHSMGEDAW